VQSSGSAALYGSITTFRQWSAVHDEFILESGLPISTSSGHTWLWMFMVTAVVTACSVVMAVLMVLGRVHAIPQAQPLDCTLHPV
jgi:hypothetical protein